MHTHNPGGGETEAGDVSGFLASQSNQIGDLLVPRETLSQKVRREEAKEDRELVLTFGLLTCKHTHTHTNTHSRCRGERENGTRVRAEPAVCAPLMSPSQAARCV